MAFATTFGEIQNERKQLTYHRQGNKTTQSAKKEALKHCLAEILTFRQLHKNETQLIVSTAQIIIVCGHGERTK